MELLMKLINKEEVKREQIIVADQLVVKESCQKYLKIFKRNVILYISLEIMRKEGELGWINQFSK
jgi:hypothetical protein